MPPTWHPRRLARHHQKRITRDRGCFEDLLGITGRRVTASEYEARSLDAFANSWAEYEAEARNIEAGEYYPPSAYFVDDDLVVAITDMPRDEFRTCYHEHFGRRHDSPPAANMSQGQRRLRYKENLQLEEKGRLIRKVRRIRGF